MGGKLFTPPLMRACGYLTRPVLNCATSPTSFGCCCSPRTAADVPSCDDGGAAGSCSSSSADRTVLSRERKVLNFLCVPRRGFDSGVFMRPTACVTVDDDVFTTPGTPWAGIAGSRGRVCVGVSALTLLIYSRRVRERNRE